MNEKIVSTTGGLILFSLISTTLVSSMAVISSSLRVSDGGHALLILLGGLGMEAVKVGAPVAAWTLVERREILAAKIVGGAWAVVFAACAMTTFLTLSAPEPLLYSELSRTEAALKSMTASIAEGSLSDAVRAGYEKRVSELRAEVAELRTRPRETRGRSASDYMLGSAGIVIEAVSAIGLILLRWATAKQGSPASPAQAELPAVARTEEDKPVERLEEPRALFLAPPVFRGPEAFSIAPHLAQRRRESRYEGPAAPRVSARGALIVHRPLSRRSASAEERSLRAPDRDLTDQGSEEPASGTSVESAPPRQETPSAFSLASVPINSTKETNFLWRHVIPNGAITLLTGQPKIGKSQILIHMAAVVSSGGTWPDGRRAEQGSVILMETEDLFSDTQRRLAAAGADLSRVLVRDSEEGPMDLSTEEGMEELKRQAARMGDVKLVGVSPALAFFGSGSNGDAEVRRRVEPFRLWIAQNRMAAVLVTHPAKRAGRKLEDQFAGSDGFRRLARSAYVAMTDDSDPNPNPKLKRRMLACAGVNGGDDATRFFYKFEVVEAMGGETTRIAWSAQPSAHGLEKAPQRPVEEPARTVEERRRLETPISVEDLPASAPAVTASDRTRRREKLKDFLKDALSDGPVSLKALKDMAALNGGAGNSTLYAAAQELGVERKDYAGGVMWSLPETRS